MVCLRVSCTRLSCPVMPPVGTREGEDPGLSPVPCGKTVSSTPPGCAEALRAHVPSGTLLSSTCGPGCPVTPAVAA